MTTADVVVIGAGVVGAAIAHRLAERGARVVVCERGGGATAMSAAQVRMLHGDPADVRLAALSLPVFENWRDEVGGDCGFRPVGFSLLVDAEHRAVADEAVKRLAEHDVIAEVLDARDYAAEHPGLRLDGVDAVAHEPRSGYADPALTTRSLLDAAVRHGARVLAGSRVHRIESVGDAVRAVHSSTGTVSADRVVIAANTGADELLTGVGVEVPLSARRIGWFAVGGIGVEGLCVTIDDTLGTYFRPWGDGGVLFRAPLDEPDPLEAARALIRPRLPAVARTPISAGGRASESYTADGKPVVGPAGPTGLYLALGPGGGGFKAAPAVGRAVAAELLDGVERDELAPYRADRFGRPAAAVQSRFRHM